MVSERGGMGFRLHAGVWLGLLSAGLAAAPMLAPGADAVDRVAEDTPAATVATLDDGLIAAMRAGADHAGEAARARLLAPVIDRAFDLAAMTRLSVGPAWAQMTARDQADLVAAFRALTIAQYAHNFNGFAGQRFVLAPAVEARGPDRLVRTTLIAPGGEPEHLDYRLREAGAPGSGQWRIIDVYYRNAISQLAIRRADFAEVLRRGGARALIAHLTRLAASPS